MYSDRVSSYINIALLNGLEMESERKPRESVEISKLHDVASENYTKLLDELPSLSSNKYRQFLVCSGST